MAADHVTAKSGKSKTDLAVDMHKKSRGKVTPYAAAKAFDVSPSNVYRRLKQLATKKHCPTCGHILK